MALTGERQRFFCWQAQQHRFRHHHHQSRVVSCLTLLFSLKFNLQTHRSSLKLLHKLPLLILKPNLKAATTAADVMVVEVVAEVEASDDSYGGLKLKAKEKNS